MPELPAPRGKSTYGHQIRTEDACQVCQSEHRAEVEDAVYLQQHGLLMPDGTKPSVAWFEKNSQALWGLNLNRSNYLTHYRKHFEEYAQRPETPETDVSTALRQQLAERGVEKVAVEEFLETVVALGYAKVIADPDKVTVDQAMKAVAELTKRKHDDVTAQLMKTLAGGIGAALSAAIPAAPAAPVIEVTAEVVPNDDQG